MLQVRNDDIDWNVHNYDTMSSMDLKSAHVLLLTEPMREGIRHALEYELVFRRVLCGE